MTAGEFVRRIAALGAARGISVRFDRTRGKGSHGTLYYGERFTVVKDRRKECGPGLLGKMLADLGMSRRDLRQPPMEQHFEYPADIEQDSAGFYLVTFPDFPEAATDARSWEAALTEAIDCLEEAVAGRMKRGDDIPTRSPAAKGTVLIALPALYSMKAALYLALREARLSQSALAARLGKNEKEVRRLLDPEHASRTAALEAALHSVGKRVRTIVSDAS